MMDYSGLTARQSETLEIIVRWITQRGQSPTLAEIGRELGVRSKGAVHNLLTGLRERGKIQWITGRNRSIVLVADRRAGHVLSPDLQARLESFCRRHAERPEAVLHDALVLHFDAIDPAAAEAFA